MPRTIPTISEFFNPSFGVVAVAIIICVTSGVVIIIGGGARSKKVQIYLSN